MPVAVALNIQICNSPGVAFFSFSNIFYCLLLFLVFNSAGVKHPDEVRGKEPGKDKRVDSAKNKASEADPCESGKSLKNCVMQINTLYSSPWQETAKKTDDINYFRAQDAFPAI